MKIVKPQKLGLLTHSFENDGRAYFVLTAMAFFPFPAPGKLLHEVALWKLAVDQIGPTTPLDAGMTKRRGEVLVAGKAFAAKGGKTTARSVRLVARAPERVLVDKELVIIGDRQWELSGPSQPMPFEEMPVGWERAFGGEGFDLNPAGRGFAPIEVDGRRVHLLPNVEDRKSLVRSKGDRPAPVGFGPIDQTWPQRFKKVGTYDARWLETRFPGFAADLDWTYFNSAPEDQQIDGYWSGRETFEIHGMHPEKGVVEARLPPVRARLMIVQAGPSGGEILREAASRIDTVWLFPNVERGVALFRGALEVAEDDGADVRHVVAAFEGTDEEPRSLEHYRTIVERRRDKKRGAMYAIVDDGLLPGPSTAAGAESDAAAVAEDDWNDMAAVVRTEGLLAKRLEKKAEREIAETRERFVAAGLDVSQFDQKVAESRAKRRKPPERLDDLPAAFDAMEVEAEQGRKAAEEAWKELEAQAREGLAKVGVDYDAAARKVKSGDAAGGPPKFSAEAQLDWLRSMVELGRNAGMPMLEAEAKLSDPTFVAALRDTERRLLEAYRRFCHFYPAAQRLGGEAAAAARRAVLEALDRRESLAGRDLTGADLSGIDFSGADMSRVMLESADLTGARLDRANLAEAALARAKLMAASLEGARLTGANFGHADLRGARFGEGVDLAGAVLYRTDLRGASLRRAKLERAQIFESLFDGADLRGADASRTLFMESSFAGADLGGAQLKDAMFVKTSLARAKLIGASAVDTSFVEVNGDDADLTTAVLHGARIVMGSSFARASFRGARLRRTCLRTTALCGSDWSGAEIPEVDFSECDLTGAKLYRAQGDGCLFMRADLTEASLVSATLKSAIFQKAKLYGADLRGANLFRSDMAKVKLDNRTNLEGAYLVQVRVVLERPKPPESGAGGGAAGMAAEKPGREAP